MTSALVAEDASEYNSTNGTDDSGSGCGDGLNLTCPEDLGGYSVLS